MSKLNKIFAVGCFLISAFSLGQETSHDTLGKFRNVRPELAMQTGHSSGILGLEFSSSGDLLVSSGKDGKIILWDILAGKQLKHLKLEDAKALSISISDKQNVLAAACSDSVVRFWSLPNLEPVDTLNFNQEIYDVKFPDEKNNSVLVGCKDLWEINLQTKERTSIYKIADKFVRRSKRQDKPMSIIEAPNYSGEGYILNYRNLEEIAVLSKKTTISVSDFDHNTYYSVSDGLIYQYQTEGMVGFINTVFNGHGDARIAGLAFDKKKNLLASGDDAGRINIWDETTGLLVNTLKGGYEKINDFMFSKDGKKMAFCTENGKFKYWNLKTNEIFSSEINPTAFNSEKGWIYEVYEIDSLSDSNCVFKVKMSNPSARDLFRFLHRPKYYELIWEYKRDRIDLRSNNSLKQKEKSDQNVFVNPIYDIQAELRNDGRISFTNRSSDSVVLNMVALDDYDYAYMTTDGYYYASKGALNYVGFRVNGKVYSFEQFDLKYNRPDLVFSKLPFTSDKVIESYFGAYQKRLSKLGIKDPNSIDFCNGPKVSIEREKIISTDLRKYSFHVDLIDDSNELRSLKVYVNGVPVYGEGGLHLSGNEWSDTVAVHLSKGGNFIQVKAINENGASSFTESFKIDCKFNFHKPDLYVVCIGSGSFIQEEFNLEYAAKDAKDVSSCLTSIKGYENKHEYTITNKSVTKDKIDEIASLLNKAKENDVVYIFIAGHGVLDANLNYFLSTYDIDFTNPAEKGISYRKLEGILSQVKAREKVLIMDACHSGEIDKEEIKRNTETAVIHQDDIVFRSVGVGASLNSSVGLQNSFDLSKSIFAEMRTSGGTSIISSASGGEYAMEGSEWNNGVFTFCLLKGLNNQEADLNRDGDIFLSELQSYLLDEVVKLTDGRQQPTSRRENLNNDFIVK